MGIGNAVGSSIANISLVIGITAVIKPLSIHSKLLKRELPILFIAMILSWILIIDGYLGRFDASMLIIAMILILAFIILIVSKARKSDDAIKSELKKEKPITMTNSVAAFQFTSGLILLFASSKMLIYGATKIATIFGISDLVIGLTIVAVGSSLPELATCISGALKGEDDLVLGNLIGSNIFNLLAVMSMPGLIHPSSLPKLVLWRDYPILFIISILLVGMSYGYKKNAGTINRIEGTGLTLIYIGYVFYLYH